MCMLYNTLDSIGLEKQEDLWGSIMHILGSGGGRIGCNPNYDGAKSILPILTVGEKASCFEDRVANL